MDVDNPARASYDAAMRKVVPAVVPVAALRAGCSLLGLIEPE